MGCFIRKFVCCAILGWGVFGFGPGLAAQGSLALANLQEDLSALRHQLASLRLTLEQVEIDQQKLKAALAASKEDYKQLQKSYIELLAQHKKDSTALLERNHKALLEELQKLLAPTPTSTKTELDYPKEGISYTVKKGDTLSKIAHEHHSKVAYIQAANHIQDPNKDLRPGQTLFIPQGK